MALQAICPAGNLPGLELLLALIVDDIIDRNSIRIDEEGFILGFIPAGQIACNAIRISLEAL